MSSTYEIRVAESEVYELIRALGRMAPRPLMNLNGQYVAHPVPDLGPVIHKLETHRAEIDRIVESHGRDLEDIVRHDAECRHRQTAGIAPRSKPLKSEIDLGSKLLTGIDNALASARFGPPLTPAPIDSAPAFQYSRVDYPKPLSQQREYYGAANVIHDALDRLDPEADHLPYSGPARVPELGTNPVSRGGNLVEKLKIGLSTVEVPIKDYYQHTPPNLPTEMERDGLTTSPSSGSYSSGSRADTNDSTKYQTPRSDSPYQWY